MSAQELRIGNIVNMGREGICSVSGYNLYHRSIYDNRGIVADYYSEWEPISLTGEWLEKLGFVIVEDLGDMVYYELKNNVSKRRYTICNDHDCWVFMLSVFNEYTPLIYDEKHFQYVHQLQNLYFALTGEELTLKK